MCSQVEQKGYFSDEVEAARAHDGAVLDVRGPDAVTNFPPSDYGFDARAWRKGRILVRPTSFRQASDKLHVELYNGQPAGLTLPCMAQRFIPPACIW